MPQSHGDSVREQAIGQGVIYRVAIEGQPPSADLSVPLETKIRSRELVLLIHNEDSPPLPISAVRVERRPVYLVFMARSGGNFHLLTGNKICAAPRYDLAALGADLKNRHGRARENFARWRKILIIMRRKRWPDWR